MPKRPALNLFSLLKLLVGVAVVLGVFATSEHLVEMECTFQGLPTNDRPLKAWFRDEFGANQVAIQRHTDSLSIRASQRGFWQYADLPEPPWEQLGYLGRSVTAVYWSSGFSAHSGLCVLVGVVVFVLLEHCRRRNGSTR